MLDVPFFVSYAEFHYAESRGACKLECLNPEKNTNLLQI